MSDFPPTAAGHHIQYGVRVYGGHVTPKGSRHVAVREIEARLAAGERNVWLVQRRVEDWQKVAPARSSVA